MSCKDDVLKISKKLEKMISSDTQDHSASMDLLNALKKIPMTLDVLQKTHIGMTVNNFRKSSKDEDVISLSKSLIKNWKKLLSTDSNSPSSNLNRSNSNSSTSAVDENSQAEKEEKNESDKEVEKNEEDEKPKKWASVGITQKKTSTPEVTGDSVRNKCREMLVQALTVEDVPEDCEAAVIAGLIEECIFKEFDNTDMKYKNRIRSRYSNLKDLKNPNLRGRVLNGDITPEKIAVMTPEEMASDNLKEVREKLHKETVKDAQLAVSGGTVTDLLKCGKCKGRRCTYNQMQTRSSDEPMTTFVFCNDCGNRWKFC